MNKETPSDPSRPSHIQSLARTFQLIDIFSVNNQEISVTELSDRLGWPKSTTYGILSTLRDYRYVEQSPITGRYKLGARFFEIGHVVSRSWDIQSIALPHMQKLHAAVSEMVQLAAEDQGEVLHLEKIDFCHKMNVISKTGVRVPMHCCGMGKVLLAYHSNAEVNSILTRKGMAAMASKTITEAPILKQQLETIRQRGYAIEDCEVMDGVGCIAAPIFDAAGHVKYAVSVTGYRADLRDTKESIIPNLKQCAHTISHDFGYRNSQENKPN
ncbi:MAG: IclR family transcriptional regulator [Peptococcaceae bacterium]|nr:IclR family transcriptional regulator [Peptococcaceae bacterium]